MSRASSFTEHEETNTATEDSQGGRILNLFYASKQFCSSCQSWDKYNEQEMSVILRPAKRYVKPSPSQNPKLIFSSDLPSYVFPDGQPPKSKKKGKREKVSCLCGILRPANV